MARKLIRIFISAFALLLIFSFGKVDSYADDIFDDDNFREIQFPVDESFYLDKGVRISTNKPAYLTEEGVTMIPLRKVCELYNLGDTISWDAISKSATITIRSEGAILREIIFTTDKSEIYINGVYVNEGAPGYPQIIPVDGQGVLYIPIRAFGLVFGFPVSWDNETRSAIFNKGNK